MSFLRQREIPIGITLIAGFLMLIDYYFRAEIPQVVGISTTVQRWAVIIAAFALLIGLINITRIHLNHLMKRTRGQWIFSIWCLFIMYLMIINVLNDNSWLIRNREAPHLSVALH